MVDKYFGPAVTINITTEEIEESLIVRECRQHLENLKVTGNYDTEILDAVYKVICKSQLNRIIFPMENLLSKLKEFISPENIHIAKTNSPTIFFSWENINYCVIYLGKNADEEDSYLIEIINNKNINANTLTKLKNNKDTISFLESIK